MNEKFKGMMDDIIRKFGFEDIHTIIFCGMCERADVPLNSIYETYDEFMSFNIMLDELSSIFYVAARTTLARRICALLYYTTFFARCQQTNCTKIESRNCAIFF